MSQGKLLVTPIVSVPDDDQAYDGIVKSKRSKSRCYKCGVRGHLVRDCTSKKKDGELSFDFDLGVMGCF